jgi:F-type H+-transporting ATPase subunit b
MLDLQASTIIFQIINFLILLVILIRFLYQPVQRMMEQRQAAVTAQLNVAAQREAEAVAERQHLEQQVEASRVESERLLAELRAAAAAERTQLLDAARAQAIQLQETSEREIREREQVAFRSTAAHVRATAAGLAATMIRAAAGPIVHQALVDRLIAEGLPSGMAADAALDVELAYPADNDLEQRLSRLTGAKLTFQVNPDLIAGARILTSHQLVVELSVRRALEDLQSRSNGIAA